MGARFWRNAIAISLAHLLALIALLRWAGETKAASAQEITWLNGGAEAETSNDEDTPATEQSATPTPEPIATTSATKSEINLPALTPTPLPTQTPKPTPSATSRPTVKPSATPKKKSTPKPAEKSAKRKPSASPAKKEIAGKTNGPSKKPANGAAKVSTGGSGAGVSGAGSGKADSATANYYGNMLHDRFYSAWEQPQSAVASGAKLSATARIRIEKDGRVSDFKVINPSGNVLVDESVAAVGKKVTHVDALPAGMGRGGPYDVTINFALNTGL